MNEGEGETVHGQGCSQIWTGSNGRVTMVRRDIWRECTDGLWVHLKVHRPVGKVSTDISDKVLCPQVGMSMGLDEIGCPLTENRIEGNFYCSSLYCSLYFISSILPHWIIPEKITQCARQSSTSTIIMVSNGTVMSNSCHTFFLKI